MKRYSIRTALLTCLAVFMILGTNVRPSSSYFTTYVTARGGYPISIQRVRTQFKETVDGNTKYISIYNNGEAPCWVRVRLFYDEELDLSVYDENKDGHWEQRNDGYWYYSDILQPGETTRCDLRVDINPEAVTGDSYNVIVVQECTPVLYRQNGQAHADWNLTASKEG